MKKPVFHIFLLIFFLGFFLGKGYSQADSLSKLWTMQVQALIRLI